MRITFKDIWIDYQNFRKAYYFYQLPTPKEVYEKHEVPVDTKTFRIDQFFFDLFKNHMKHPFLSPSYLFTSISILMFMYFSWRLGRKPFEWYYHFEDPLKSSGDDISTPEG